MNAFLSTFALLSLTAPVPADEILRPPEDAAAFVEETDRLVSDALATLEVVPAIALAVVVEDDVVLARAWGTADVDAGTPADADTQFYIASATKSFTALLGAILDARGTLDLDSSFAEHLDGATVDPQLRPDDVKLRDFLSHTSGIDNGPIGFRVAYTGEHDPDTLWALLDACAPMANAPLGTYRYTNVGYNILGMIIDRETGKVWQDHLRDEIFAPLGMTRTTAYASLGERNGWVIAAPHFGVGPDGIERLYLQKHDNTMQSAGGMMLTANDAARWMLFQLNEGELDGRQIVPAEVVRLTQEPLTATQGPDGSPFDQEEYGYGWSHGNLHGNRVLSHGGGFAGFRSIVSFMPDMGIGVTVMVNESTVGSELLKVLVRSSYEWWLGDEPDADEAIAQLAAQRQSFIKQVADDRYRKSLREWELVASARRLHRHVRQRALRHDHHHRRGRQVPRATGQPAVRGDAVPEERDHARRAGPAARLGRGVPTRRGPGRADPPRELDLRPRRVDAAFSATNHLARSPCGATMLRNGGAHGAMARRSGHRDDRRYGVDPLPRWTRRSAA